MKLLLLLFTALFLSSGAFAQTVETAAEQSFREGRYVTVTMQLGNPIKLFVSGKERARFRTDDLKLEVRSLKGNNWEELRINEYGNYYTVKFSNDGVLENEMEVRTTLKNKKSETFRFKLY